jgi:serine/threonine protein phosphatase 1
MYSMQRVFLVGDIHGCNKTFRKLVTDSIGLTKNDQLFCVGDYIDRGENSKGVVDFIIDMRNQGYSIVTLRGNHEQMLLDSDSSPENYSRWLLNGGGMTLESFGVRSAADLDQKYLDFFTRTEFYASTSSFIAVHAGLNFRISNPLSDYNSMLWIRDFKPDHTYLGNRLLVHGHTPVDHDYLESQSLSGVINVDGGCVYRHIPGMGHLFALELNNGRFISEKNID